MGSLRQITLAAPLIFAVGGCASLREHGRADSAADSESLTLVVAELKLHMRDDTYRFDRAVAEDGRNVYAVGLWKLDRLAVLRARPEAEWQNADYVIEFARARALERMRRFADAAQAYRRVEAAGSVLGDSAGERARWAERFAYAAGPPAQPFAAPADELEYLDARIALWRQLAIEARGTPRESLALEEAEAFGMMRIDWFARSGQVEQAISACRSLIESNRASKLYGKHLLRLGDLYADAARREQLLARADAEGFEPEQYDALLDQAFSAYELAGEDRKPALRHEAQTRIEALLAYHEGVKAHAP